MLDAGLGNLERHRAIEDRLAVLDRDDAAHRETRSVARALDVVDDRLGDIARAQEIRMQRMRAALRIARLLRGRQRLAEHLPAEYPMRADVAALAAEEIVFELLEAEQGDEFCDECVGHGRATLNRAGEYSDRLPKAR